MNEAIRDWLKEQLLSVLQNSDNAQQFINEKKQKSNGKVYKYCPLNDSTEEIQYSIDNLENAIVYMSRVSSFNDPFDTYLSFSLDGIIHNLVSRVVEQNAEIDESIKPMVPVAFDLIMTNENAKLKNPIMKYLIVCLKKHPNVLKGKEDPAVLTTELIKLITTDLLNGNILEDDMNAFSEFNTNPNELIVDLIRECINNPQLLEISEEDANSEEFQKAQKILGGQFTELESIRSDYHQTIESIKPEISIAMKKAREIINEKFYISCFSTSANNALMWAHYSNKHKGFCVEFDLNKTKIKNFLINLHPVIYSKKRALIPSSIFDLTDINNIKISKSVESTVDLICELLTKSDVWKYEDEWRLLLYDEVEELKDNKIEVDCISKVILGCRIEEQYESRITEICRVKGIHLSKMRLDESNYEMHEEMIF